MIEGIKIQLKTEELQHHLSDKVKYHMDKNIFYEDQVETLKSGGVKSEAVTNDPVSSLEQSAKKHKGKAEYFQFIVDHLIANETYQLSETDLTKLEIISYYF